MFGLTADLDPLLSLKVPVIEDCAQAVGGTYRKRLLGAWGRAAVFSFYATKVITTGEGGMVVSDSKRLIERVRGLREYDKFETTSSRFNYKMTDMQAAMGRVQLKRLGDFVRRRRHVAKQYREVLEGYNLALPPDHPGHIYYRYVIRLKKSATGLIRRLKDQGVACVRPVYKPLHSVLKLKGYPATESAWRQSISIPIYPSLSEDQRERVIEKLKDVF
jgi:dTDP-4-amino-4,6-dideoxygalactose transaminase